MFKDNSEHLGIARIMGRTDNPKQDVNESSWAVYQDGSYTTFASN